MTHPPELRGAADRLLDSLRHWYAGPPDDLPTLAAHALHHALLVAYGRSVSAPNAPRAAGLPYSIRAETARIRKRASDVHTPADAEFTAIAESVVAELGTVVRRIETEFAHQL